MSPTKYAIAICDDEKYWQNQILNCCKLLENDIQREIDILNNELKQLETDKPQYGK